MQLPSAFNYEQTRIRNIYILYPVIFNIPPRNSCQMARIGANPNNVISYPTTVIELLVCLQCSLV